MRLCSSSNLFLLMTMLKNRNKKKKKTTVPMQHFGKTSWKKGFGVIKFTTAFRTRFVRYLTDMNL